MNYLHFALYTFYTGPLLGLFTTIPNYKALLRIYDIITSQSILMIKRIWKVQQKVWPSMFDRKENNSLSFWMNESGF